MSSPTTAEVAAHKRKRSPSHSPEADGAPPSSRRRARSPSEDSGSDSEGPSPPKDGKLEARVAAMDLDNAEQKAQSTALVKAAEKEKEKESAQRAEFAKLLNTRSGGVYIPPARLRAMQAAASSDKSSPEYQRLSWDALRKSITGIVNRVNVTNIKLIVPELFNENLVRGRGLFARSVMKAQSASLPFTPVFAALVSIINTKLPQVGELVLTRLISQFRRSFKRNDKTVCHSSTTFIAHLVNQAVAHEIIALQILVLLLERPTDDSIEIAVGFTREVGAFLAENSPKANATVFERFRAVLNEGKISQRVQYMIEVLMQVRKDKYKDNPILPEGLDLVEEDEQITHQIQLEEELQVQEGLNIFKFDPNYLESEEKYKSIKAEILGEDSDEESGSGSEEDSDEDEDEVAETKEGIEDRTETNLVNLRRIIYLTIMNALNYEEAVHKLLKIQLQEGQEIELVNMIIECCSQERSYSTFYGLIGERFSKLNRVWTDAFEQAFTNYYTTIHRYETNRLRNIARFFGHLISTDSISWMVFECVKINEDDTTSSSRIFVKIMMQEMMESMGLKNLAERFKDPEVSQGCAGMFPMDIPKNTRFSINYFTSIGLGVLTEGMREYLKNAPKLIMEQRRAMLEAESSSSSDSDSDSDSDSSDSDSGSSSSDGSSSAGSRRGGGSRRRRASRSRTPPRHRGRDDSRSRSRSRSPPRRKADRSPPPVSRRRGYSGSRSPPPPPRRPRVDSSRSPPPPPRNRERERERERERSLIPPPRSSTRDVRDRDTMDTKPDGISSRRPHSPSPSPPPPRGGGYSRRPPSPGGREREQRGDRYARPLSPPPVGTETEMVEGDLGLLPLICHVVVAEQMSQDATTLVADTEIDPGRLQGANAKERVADRVHPENKITDTPAGARQDA
ncbi:hypothetical protein CVT25_008354 [Psilocybe cyanescens]|uniref:MI domain-containing protein n=1 Tax=Psilocybe cyanescens TaxID=93625 RepID=A0A409WV50_PSICY|nr:hypothetical protein CVT25_008354 [Psilocybe cyanescens]